MLAELIPKLAEMTAEEEHPFYPRPSMAGPERCIRQMVYHGLEFPREPLPGRALIIFSDSSFHEDLTHDWLRKSAYTIHSEQMKVKCRAPMKSGHIDAIFTDIFKVDRLEEHKGLNHFTVERYWNGGELPLDNLTQTAIYIDAIQQESTPDLKEGILLIKNKNTAGYIEYLCRYEGYEDDILHILERTRSDGQRVTMDIKIENIVADACAKFESVLGYIAKKTLPPRQYDFDHWRCEYCGWGKSCWENYIEEFNALKTDEMLPGDVADMVRYYKESGAQVGEMKKEYDDLRKKIKDTMKDLGVREGRAGEYIVKLNVIETERIDKVLLTEEERKRASKPGMQERLNIRKAA